MAMGASRRRVLGMVLGQGMRLAAVGLVAGVAASLLLTRLLQTQLFNVQAVGSRDARGRRRRSSRHVAFVACYIPAQPRHARGSDGGVRDREIESVR